MLVGGEREGLTLTSEEKVGCRDFDNKRASNLLNLSHHFWSNSEILSTEDEVETLSFFALVGALSFSSFFSGGSTGDLSGLASLTTPITDTVKGSTRELSLEGVELSRRLASLFSFLSLYDGVEICACCSGVKRLQR